MALDRNRLRDQIIFLELVDTLQFDMDPRRYLDAARAVRRTVKRELGVLPMEAFVNGVLPTLQTTAENVFFEGHGRFPDLDGSGQADEAQRIAERLLRRARRRH